MHAPPVGFGPFAGASMPGNLGVLVSAYNTGDVSCEVNGRTILPMPYSVGFLNLVFNGGRNIIPSEPVGFDDSLAKMKYYQRLIGTHCRNIQRQVDHTFDSRQQARSPQAELFEIPVTKGLYTYLLAFPDASYIRTPLRQRVVVN